MLRTIRPVPLAAALLLTGCLDSWKRPTKAPASAVWINSNSVAVEAGDLSRLKEAGIGEVFLSAARLDFASSEGPLVPLELPSLPASAPATLAVSGRFELDGDPGPVGERVAEAARQLRFRHEGRGGIVVGIHFDVLEVGSLRAYAAFLEALRGELDRELLLSASVPRDWLADSALEEVAGAVDFLVPFLYGQRVNESEDGAAWDFIALEQKLQDLEPLGAPYMLGIVGLGTATHLSKNDAVKARMTRLSLQQILWNRDLKLRPGFSLEGVNRRVYAVIAERPTQVGKWQVKPGESIRAVRAATSDLEELMRLLEVWQLPNHLGQVYYRLPAEDERLSLTLENVLTALDPEPAAPQLEFGVDLQRRTGRGWLVRFAIHNQNGEITELSLMESNYLEIHCKNGVFGQRVNAGDFYRYDLLRTTDSGELERTFRNSDILRLHLPILEGQQTIESGDVEILLRGEPELDLKGQFLLPDGRKLSVGPRPWPEPADAG